MKTLCLSLSLITLALANQLANAHTLIYEFDLSGLNERPPVATTGSGFARATFDLDLVTMRIEANFQDLLGNATAAHIHCCDFNAAGNAGVATMTPSFLGFPTGGTSGTYDHTFDMTLASSYRAAFITASGGTISGALSALLAELDTGRAYFNIHSSLFGPGEIRGQAVFVPEPASAMLALVSLGLPLFTRRFGR
jgi:hypothetical protein